MTDKIEEALHLEGAGDALATEGKYREALDTYRHAERLNPNRAEIYVKLIDCHERLSAQSPEDFEREDMADVLTWTMRAQELDTPRLRYLHRYLSQEDKRIHKLLQELLATPDPQEEGRLLDAIEAQGERATAALLHFFLTLKHKNSPSNEL